MAGRLSGLSDRLLFAEARRHAYHLDPHSFVARARNAVADRRVTIRPAPDTMAWVTALLPAAQGVAVHAALTRDADARRGQGDQRSRGQLMADTLVERVTGQVKADQVPVEIAIVMSDQTLLGEASTPAVLQGYGPVPAPAARHLVADLDDPTAVWLRRVYTHPTTGQLTGMDSRRRPFDGGLRRVLVIRDRLCRTPWCGAPIRHLDHPVPIRAGGQTNETNGQGLCEACNQTKEAPGWRARPSPTGGAGEAVEITTPTGHTYTSRPPPLPGTSPDDGSTPSVESGPTLRIDMYVHHPFRFEYAA